MNPLITNKIAELTSMATLHFEQNPSQIGVAAKEFDLPPEVVDETWYRIDHNNLGHRFGFSKTVLLGDKKLFICFVTRFITDQQPSQSLMFSTTEKSMVKNRVS